MQHYPTVQRHRVFTQWGLLLGLVQSNTNPSPQNGSIPIHVARHGHCKKGAGTSHNQPIYIQHHSTINNIEVCKKVPYEIGWLTPTYFAHDPHPFCRGTCKEDQPGTCNTPHTQATSCISTYFLNKASRRNMEKKNRQPKKPRKQ